MPYLTVRAIVNQELGSSVQVIIDWDPVDKAVESLMVNQHAMSNRGCEFSRIINGNPTATLGDLERIGYKVVAANSARKNSTEAWQVWTLHKEA